MIVQFRTGIVNLPGWPDYVAGIVAIECREYKTTCQSCRYARWFGQDVNAANVASSKHKHACNVDYLMHPGNLAHLRRMYARSVKPRVGVRSSSFKGARRVDNFVTPMAFPPVNQSDIPPF